MINLPIANAIEIDGKNIKWSESMSDIIKMENGKTNISTNNGKGFISKYSVEIDKNTKKEYEFGLDTLKKISIEYQFGISRIDEAKEYYNKLAKLTTRKYGKPYEIKEFDDQHQFGAHYFKSEDTKIIVGKLPFIFEHTVYISYLPIEHKELRKKIAARANNAPLLSKYKKGIFVGMTADELEYQYELEINRQNSNSFDIKFPKLIDNDAELIRVFFDNDFIVHQIVANYGKAFSNLDLKNALIGVYGRPNNEAGLESTWRDGNNLIRHKIQYLGGNVYNILTYENIELSKNYEQALKTEVQMDSKRKTDMKIKNWW